MRQVGPVPKGALRAVRGLLGATVLVVALAPATAGAHLTMAAGRKAAVDQQRAFWTPEVYHEVIGKRGCHRIDANTIGCTFTAEGEGTNVTTGEHKDIGFEWEVRAHRGRHKLAVWQHEE